MIRDLIIAAPYSLQLQEAYENLCKKITGEVIFEELDDKQILEWAKKMYELLGINTKGFALTISKNKTYVQGFNRRAGGSTARIYLTPDFTKTKGKFREAIIAKLGGKNSGVNPVSIGESNVVFSYKEDYFFNLLKLSQTKDPKTGASIIDLKDANVFEDVKASLKKRILDRAQQSNVDMEAFNSALNEVFSKMRMTDLFAGHNAPKNMTGLLGEIQGLYFIKSIIKNKEELNVSWNASVLNEKDVKPHRDLIFSTLENQYGVQIKNSIEQVEKDITFQTFKTGTAKEIINSSLFTEMPNVFKTFSFTGDREVLEAALNILAMREFNIMYQIINKKASAMYNENFVDTRNKIEEVAQMAEKAMLGFSAAMMFMQTSSNINLNQDSNSLYIIGGTLGISSASILSDIITQIEQEIKKFNINTKTSHTYKNNGKRTQNVGTIVDFFNAKKGRHLDSFSISFQSSYNF